MTQSSTQSYLSDVDDKPEDDYFMQGDVEDRPTVVRDLMDLWDGLVDEGRWTSGNLYYGDGLLAEGRIDISRLAYDESGRDRHGKPRKVHWKLSTHDPSTSSDGRRIISVSGFMNEEGREIRQSIRDQDQMIAAAAAESKESRPRSIGPESRKVGARTMRMA